jgi:hypothetical protein
LAVRVPAPPWRPFFCAETAGRASSEPRAAPTQPQPERRRGAGRALARRRGRQSERTGLPPRGAVFKGASRTLRASRSRVPDWPPAVIPSSKRLASPRKPTGLPECSRWSVAGGGRPPETDAKTPWCILKGCQNSAPCAAGLRSSHRGKEVLAKGVRGDR